MEIVHGNTVIRHEAEKQPVERGREDRREETYAHTTFLHDVLKNFTSTCTYWYGTRVSTPVHNARTVHVYQVHVYALPY